MTKAIFQFLFKTKTNFFRRLFVGGICLLLGPGCFKSNGGNGSPIPPTTQSGNPSGQDDLSVLGTGIIPAFVPNAYGYPDWIGGAIDIQSNGQIVVGSAERQNVGALDSAVVKRFNTDGTLDTSFGNTGASVISFSNDSKAEKVIVLSSGKIVVVGTAYDSGWKPFVARLLSNGTLDTQFGISGIQLLNIESRPVPGWISDVVVQPDNKILLGGYDTNGQANTPGQYNYLLVRLLDTGILDSAFGSGGMVTINSNPTVIVAYTNDEKKRAIRSIKLTSDGHIILVGAGRSSLTVSSNESQTIAVKLDSTGAIDTTFGDNGFVGRTLADFSAFSSTFGMVASANGAYFLLNQGTFSGTSGTHLFVLNNSDIENATTSSWATLSPTKRITEAANAMEIQDMKSFNNTLLISGYQSGNSYLSRFDQAGNLQSTFGNNGLIQFSCSFPSFDVDARGLRNMAVDSVRHRLWVTDSCETGKLKVRAYTIY